MNHILLSDNVKLPTYWCINIYFVLL